MESVRSQDYGNVEHILVDGASTDGTVDVIKQFPHVAGWISEKDSGLYDAMNKGLGMVTGDIVAILNSDDIYADHTVISRVCEIFIREQTDSVYGDLQYVANGDTNKVVRTWKSGSFNRQNFYYGWMPPHPAFFVRKHVYNDVGLFNTSLRSAADYEMMLRILFKFNKKAAYLPGVLVKMRTGGLSGASWKHRLRANREDRLAWIMNDLHPPFFTLLLKPLRKIPQFVLRKR